MEKNMIIAIVIGMLVMVAAVQAVELSVLNSKISTGKFTTGSSTRTTGAAAGSASGTTGSASGTDLNQLSGMVGGC